MNLKLYPFWESADLMLERKVQPEQVSVVYFARRRIHLEGKEGRRGVNGAKHNRYCKVASREVHVVTITCPIVFEDFA